jgi:hypothetical protein
MKIQETVIFPAVLYEFKAWSLILRKEHRLKEICGRNRKRGSNRGIEIITQ